MSGAARRSRPERAALLAVGLLAALTSPALADNDVHGRVQLQDMAAFARYDSLDNALGVGTRNDFLGNLRITWEPSWDRFSIAFHYVVNADIGDGARLRRLESALIPAPPPTWFNLTETFEDHGQVTATQGIDRLAIGYTTPDFVIRIGRQALTWGAGLVFHPMDLFDPFSPNATDTEYKPGTDMLYTQFLFGDGSDLQFIVVPRPPEFGAQPSMNASSIALHYHGSLFGHATTLLVARDHGDWVTAVGVSGALGEATWNVEFVPTFVNGGATRFSALANISDAITLLDSNATVFAEYFHNGFGVEGEPFSLSTLPSDLVDRLARGQLFNLRRDYLAAGLTLEVDPLLSLSPTLIADLNDPSLYALVAVTYSLEDNLTLVAGAQTPIGAHGTEFGGVPLTPASPLLVGPPAQLYLQVRRYF
jgi:hypothetical protein